MLLVPILRIKDMARGRGRGSGGRVGKSSFRCDSTGRANMPTIPIPTTVSPQQGGRSFIGGPDPINEIQTLSTPPVQASDTARGKGRGSEDRVGKSSLRGDSACHANMPTIPILTTVGPQQGGTSSIDSKCVEKSEINAKNRYGGKEVAAGTHTGGSICIGEHRKRLAVAKGRDPTLGEVHLHVHTHDHDGESFVDERARAVHHITKLLGEQGREEYMVLDLKNSYYGLNLCVTSGFNASASTPPSTSQSAPIENMEELVMRLIPTLTERLLPLFIEKARGVISSPSHRPNTPIENPSVVTPIVLPTTAANVDDVDPLVSDDDRSPSPMH